MSEKKWTEEQKKIIDAKDKNLLVSASAGCGKTTVMIERIASLMERENLPISEFLVVTFTKASAEDMKKKLVERLQKCQDNDFLFSQIENVSSSDISDLHSFCYRLIMTYFYEADVDPSAKIIDANESAYFQGEALERLFEEKEKSDDENYFLLLEIFQNKRDDVQLRKIILSLNDYLNANIDGKAWFLERLKNSTNCNINENKCAKLINEYVFFKMAELVNLADDFAKKCFDMDCQKLYDVFVEISSSLKLVSSKKPFLENMKVLYDLKFPRLPSMKDEKFKMLLEEAKIVKKEISSNVENFVENYVSDNYEILEKGLKFSDKILTELFNLTIEFNEIYTKLKKEINGIDFCDLERLALKVLSNPEIQKSVQEKYKYVFVDEYQDINEVQEKIISLASSNNNRFMVGDIKQSIYRFRLCDPEIFLEKYKIYSASKDGKNEVVKLNANYRSDKKILAFVDMIFSGVMTKKFGDFDYEKESKFIAGNKDIDVPDSVNLCYIDTSSVKEENKVNCKVYSVKNHEQEAQEEKVKMIAEANYVKAKIDELLSDESLGICYGDIAILVASRNEDVKIFARTLRGFGLPVSSDEKIVLNDDKYVAELLDFVKFSCNNQNDYLMFKVLKNRFFNFSDEELIRIRKIDNKIKFYECVFEFEKLDDEKLKKKIRNFFEVVQKFNFLARVLSVRDFVKKVIESFDLYAVNLLELEGRQINERVDKFILLLPEKQVFDFVLNVNSYKFEFNGECENDSIKIMTIHKSKGIEFKAVFIINMSKNFNLTDFKSPLLISKDLGVGVDYFDLENRVEYSSIPRQAIKIHERIKTIEEQQRVLYVALTRAKLKLFLVCSKDKDKLNEKFPNKAESFINWFEPIVSKELKGENLPLVKFEKFNVMDLANSKNLQEKDLIFGENRSVLIDEFSYKFEDSCLVPIKTSITKMLKDGDFDFEYEKRQFSEEITSSADRGTLYHKFFQNVDFKSKDFEKQIKTIKENKFSEEERKILDENLIDSILKFDLFKEIKPSSKVLKEREFYAYIQADNGAKDDIILQGVIDLLVVGDDKSWILDYKTGSCTDEKLEKYKFQLENYAKVAEKALGKKIDKKYILFIDLKKLIEI